MTEPNAQTPAEQAPALQQQAPAAPAAPAGDNWKARHDGLLPVVQQRGERIKELEAELARQTSEIERLSGQLTLKDVEKSSAVAQRDTQLQEYVSKNTELGTELQRLQALEAKLKAANELGRPELMQLSQHLPDITDTEVLKTIMSDIDKFASARAVETEKRLTAGVVPAAGGFQASGEPASAEEWLKKINQESDPRKRNSMLNSYGDWLEQHHK